VKVRPIEATDRGPLARLLRSITEFKPEEVEVAEELIASSIADASLSPELRTGSGAGYTCLVACDEQDVVRGYICYGPTPMTASTFDLYWIAVDPTLQGRGIGRALYVAFAAEVAARFGAREPNAASAEGAQIRIETSSQESYAKTGGFYERLGFSVDGRLRDFYAPGDDLLIFYRRL
jgi:ribosomal protein S18 acetylase RimI-like enzyme